MSDTYECSLVWDLKEITKELAFLPLFHFSKLKSRCFKECAYHIVCLENLVCCKETPLFYILLFSSF